MVEEVTRIAEKGCHAVTFTENPYALGYPSLHTNHWDPFWAACADLETVICMHLGSSSQIHITSPDAPVNVRLNQSGISLYACASDLSWAPMLRKYDNLKFALSEGGIGWMPYFLERLDYVYQHHYKWTQQDFGDRLPSEVFKEHIILCFIDDDFGMANYDQFNTDMVTWECDYPHSDTTWPTAPELASRSFAHAPDDIVRKISHQNAMRLFQFDPTPIRPLERCTVAALRSEVPGHDISIVPRGINPNKALLSGDLATLGGVPGRDF
jgi:predicted TIM-barrel fold metal-dependent hydrolase